MTSSLHNMTMNNKSLLKYDFPSAKWGGIIHIAIQKDMDV